MATSEEIKNALIGQLATFNGSSTEAEAMASENIGKIYVPTDEDVIIINKRRVGCGRNATTEKDGLMSTTDKKNFDAALIHLDSIDKQLAEIPNDYATKTELNAVDTKTTTASTNATNALSKVNNIINGTTVIPSATNAQNAQTATNLTGKPVFAKGTTNTNAVTVTVGGQKSTEFTVPYATKASNATTADSATKATNDGGGKNIANTYATKEEVEADFTAVNNSLAIASSTATEALGKANDAKGKVDNIISGTTVVPTATNAQEAQKATQDGNGNEITKTYATKAELKTTNDSLGTTAATANDAKSKVDKIISGATVVKSATNAQTAQTATNLANKPTLAKGTNDTNAVTVTAGGKKSDEFVVPYATTADKATKDGSGNNIVNTYATKEELNDKLNASDAMVLAGSISGTGVIQKHNDNVVSQNVKEGTTNISALTDYKAGWTWRVVSDGTITDIGKVESGDMVMCVSDYKSAYKASDWTAIQRNIDLATSNSSGLMSATDKANLDAALIQLDGIDTKISNIEGDITNIENDLTNTYATKTEMGAVEGKAGAAQSTANEAKSIANSLVNGTTKAKEAETADSATKATQDGNGKVIGDTYALRGEAVATQDLGKYVPVNKHTGGTLAFPLATQSAGGAMSSADKKKLDDTEGTYYSHFNVTGSGWYRLVNVPVARWLDKYLVVDIVNAAGSAASNSFKIYYNSPMGWGDEISNSFICAPLTRTNTQCVGDVRLVYKGGAPAQYIDAYIILPEGTTNLKVSIKSNIDAKYLAKNPVGADGKEGVAEAVLIALPDGYGSIVRNAYVGYLTNNNPQRVVGGLFSERALQDINGNRIDAQYATKDVATTSKAGLMDGDMVKKIDNIQLSVDKKVPIIQMLQEAYDHQVLIPYMQNDIAYPIKRGGYIKVFVDGVEKTGIDDTMCNGMPDFEAGKFAGVTKTSVVTIEIDGAKTIDAASSAFITFPSFWLIPTNIKLEVKTLETDEWTVVKDVTDNATACFACNTTSYTYRYLKYTISGFPSTQFRVCEIGVAAYNSGGLRNIVLSRGGGEMYGNITPYKNNGASLGSADKAWATIFSTSHYFKRSDGGLAFLGAVGNNVALYTKNGDDSTLFVFDDAAKSFRRGGNAKDMTIGQNSNPWKNVFATQLTSTATDGTAPLVVSSKTMVANLNAQYARMLFSNSNSPVNAGNYFTPVYFNGGVPTSCSVLNNNKNFGGIPYVSDAGNFPIGKMLQFHTTSDEDTNKNANLRITARDANDADGEGLTIGGTTIASGKFAQYSGSVYAVATLSNYWAKLWSFSLKNSNSDRNITMHVTGRTANHTESSGIIKIRIRLSSKTVTNNGVTSVTIVPDVSLRQIVGNIDTSEFKLYYKVVSDDKGNISQGDFELWCNTEQIWGYRSAVILNSSAEGAGDNNAYKGTFFKKSFNTVQTPTLPNYVEMTNVTINQTAAKALAADKAYNADNAVYLRTTNVTSDNKDFPILWSGSETLNTEQVNSNVYRSYNDLSYNPSKKRITTGLFKGCIESVAIPTTDAYSLQYVCGQPTLGDAAGNAKEGSNADPNIWSYPKGSTGVNETSANIQTLRFRWSGTHFHDLFMSPNHNTIWNRCVINGTPSSWMKIVEATEDGRVIIEGTTYEDTLRIKNKDRSTGEIHIFNGEQGNAVIRHYEGSQTTDLKFNSTQVMHGSKSLAYSSDVTALQKEIANLKKTVQEQATLIEALQSALTWE